MNIDNQEDEKKLNSAFKNSNLNNLKELIIIRKNEQTKSLKDYPESIIKEYNCLGKNNPQNIYELIMIIEEMNKKVFNF